MHSAATSISAANIVFNEIERAPGAQPQKGSSSRDEPFYFYTIYENLYVFTGSHNEW